MVQRRGQRRGGLRGGGQGGEEAPKGAGGVGGGTWALGNPLQHSWKASRRHGLLSPGRVLPTPHLPAWRSGPHEEWLTKRQTS